MEIQINSEWCKGCGICYKICPFGAIEFVKIKRAGGLAVRHRDFGETLILQAFDRQPSSGNENLIPDIE